MAKRPFPGRQWKPFFRAAKPHAKIAARQAMLRRLVKARLTGHETKAELRTLAERATADRPRRD